MNKDTKIIWKPIDDLIPYEHNAKEHNEKQLANLEESFRRYGWQQPCLITNDNVIITGHGRALGAKRAGLTDAPCIYCDDLTEKEIKEYRHLDNLLSEGDYIQSELEFELPELDFSDFDLDFDVDFGEEEKEIIEDEAPEPPTEPKAKLGDLYILGNNRLICGDSTDVAVIDRLMDGVKADMVFTDPPYGVAYTGGMKIENGKIESNGKKQIKNDSLDYEGLYQLLYKAFINLKRFSREKAPLYIFYAHSRSREFLNAFADAGLKQRSIIIWHKTSGGFGDFMAQYMNAYEPCIYGSNGNAVDWYGASNEKTVWDMDKEKKCDLHPTMKPIELVARAIRNSSKKDDSVLDLFGGSGSTLIACEQLNRKCYMCELDPKYVSVIIQRWENFTGQKAVQVSE